MAYQKTNFKICLSLFGCEVNILLKQHIVHCTHCRKCYTVKNNPIRAEGSSAQSNRLYDIGKVGKVRWRANDIQADTATSSA